MADQPNPSDGAAALALPCKADDLDGAESNFYAEIERLLAEFRAQSDARDAKREASLTEKTTRLIQEAHEAWVRETELIDRRYEMPAGSESGDDGRRRGTRFSISKMAASMKLGSWEHAPFEKEVVSEYMKQQNQAGNDALGGFLLVPPAAASEVLDLLRANVVLTKLGVTEINGGRPIEITLPKITGDPAAVWIGEAELIPKTTATFGKITLKPRKLAARAQVTTELVAHSAPTADQVIINSMAAQFAIAIDRAGLLGEGNKEPIGVSNHAAHTQDFTTGTAPAIYSNLVMMIAKVAGSNAMSMGGSRLGWAIHPDVQFKAMISAGDKGTSGADPEVARRILTEGPMSNFISHPFETTTQLAKPTGTPTTGTGGVSLIFGDWTALYMGRWSSLAIRTSDTAGDAFETDTIYIRAIGRADVNVAYPEAFAIGTKYPSLA